MSAAKKLAQVLAEHTICWNGPYGQFECTGDDATYESAEHCDAEVEHAAHLAAVVLAHLTAEGWAQGREEWEVRVSRHRMPVPEIHADAIYVMPRLFRRRVTDWEPADA